MAQEKTKIITGSIALTSGAYVSAAAAFIVSVLLARFLTKELYGVYVFTISFASMCYLFTNFGIDGVTSYFVQRYKDKKLEIAKYFIFFGVKVKSILSALVLVVMIILGLYYDQKYWYAALFFAFFVPNHYMRIFLNSLQHFRLAGILSVIESCLRLLFIYIILNFITTKNLSTIIVGVSLPMLICALISARDVFNAISHVSSKISFNEIKQEAFFYWRWMVIGAILLPTTSNIMQVTLGMLNMFGALAIFGVGMSLSNLVRILATSFKSSMTPSFMKKTDEKEVSHALTDSIRYMLLFAIFIALLIHFISEPLIITFYTPKYADAATIFEILAYGIIFSIIFAGLRPAATSIRKPYINIFADLINLAIMVTLASLLIPRYTILGAAIALTSGLIGGTTFTALAVHRCIHYKFPLKTLVRCTFASIASLLPLQLIKTGMLQSLILDVCLGVTIYIFLLYLLREIGEEDIKLFRASVDIIIDYIGNMLRLRNR